MPCKGPKGQDTDQKLYLRSQYRPCPAAQLACEWRQGNTAAACSARPDTPASSSPLPVEKPANALTTLPRPASTFASSLFVRSRLDEIIERELRDLNARELVAKRSEDSSDATSVSSNETDEGFCDKVPRNEMESGLV